MQDREDAIDFSEMDDSTVLGKHAVCVQLEGLLPLSPGRARLMFSCDASTAEVDDRARAAWARRS